MGFKLDSWKPNYQEFQNMFSNDNNLKIMMIISQYSRKNQDLCATDIAKILDMHISTATKYLELLCKNKFVTKKQKQNKPGKPTYYRMSVESVSITLDLPFLFQMYQESQNLSEFPSPYIREKPNLEPRVSYSFNDDGIIRSIMIKAKTKTRRIMRQKIILSETESAFMKYIPHPTMNAEPFLDICRKAGIDDYFVLKEIFIFLEKLKKYEIVESIE